MEMTNVCLLLYLDPKASQNMTYWHNWWNQLTDFQKQVILLMSFVDDFWSSLTEGQQMATGKDPWKGDG